MKTRETVRPCLSDMANTQGSAETPGGAAETVEKYKLNSSFEAEEKITVKKKTKSNK